MRKILSLALMLCLLSASSLADPPGPPPTPGGNCDFTAFKEKLAFWESSGRCTARNNSFMGKYQLGKKDALVDIEFTNPDGSWRNGLTDEKFLNDCNLQEQAMDKWIVKMHGYIQSGKTSDGQLVTSYLNKQVGGCTVSWAGLLAGRHLCGMGNSGKSGFSNKCWVKKYTGIIAFLETNGAADGVDGNRTPISKYICGMQGYRTPFDNPDYQPTTCGGPPQPGGGGDNQRDGYDDKGAYGDNWDPQPEIRHYKLIDDLIKRIWVAGLQLMAEQMTATMMMQAEIVGALFDSKHQLETQRLFQEKTARAHKDYQPSEQMCTVGTFARNLANTDRRAQMLQMTLSQRAMQRETMAGDAIGTQGGFSDQISRFETYRKKFCNPKDNAGGNIDLCESSVKPDMMNKDIDFTRAIDMPLTLELDVLDQDVSDDELTVFSLMDNLFVSHLPKAFPKEITTLEAFVLPYQNLRSVIAMRSVARNSMNNIVAQKSQGPETEDGKGSNAPYLRAFIRDMGITDEEEITKLIGERPSYWAQMEILTKKIYQDPNFTVNLYDKPANVARIRAAMKAIKVMQDRDIYEALLRREMLISILTELAVRQQQERVTSFIARENARQ